MAEFPGNWVMGRSRRAFLRTFAAAAAGGLARGQEKNPRNPGTGAHGAGNSRHQPISEFEIPTVLDHEIAVIG
jgi:hypothetical protein